MNEFGNSGAKPFGDVEFLRRGVAELERSAGEIPYNVSREEARVAPGGAVDYTERKRFEDELRQSQKMEAIGRFAGGIAHDFNNLLTVVNCYTELLLRRLDEHQLDRAEAEQIAKAGERAAALVRQLMVFSGQEIVQPVVLDLNEAVSLANKMLVRLIGQEIELVTRLDKEPALIEADPGQIEQVLVNMVSNARDAMPRGGQLIVETATVDQVQSCVGQKPGMAPGPWVLLKVSDNGAGMDEATRSRIFEPFFTTGRSRGRSGLGLSTVYGIVKRSGGCISVSSTPGQGSAFRAYFPRVSVETQQAPQRRVLDEPSPGGVETVLVVEDEEAIRKLVHRCLAEHGYKVLVASNPEIALQVFERQAGQVDLLLTDMVMPGMNGRELAARIVKTHPGIRVLYMSGYPSESISDHGILPAGTAFLRKPFTPSTLLGKVREALTDE